MDGREGGGGGGGGGEGGGRLNSTRFGRMTSRGDVKTGDEYDAWPGEWFNLFGEDQEGQPDSMTLLLWTGNSVTLTDWHKQWMISCTHQKLWRDT